MQQCGSGISFSLRYPSLETALILVQNSRVACSSPAQIGRAITNRTRIRININIRARITRHDARSTKHDARDEYDEAHEVVSRTWIRTNRGDLLATPSYGRTQSWRPTRYSLVRTNPIPPHTGRPNEKFLSPL